MELEDRFWSKVDKTGQCWVWTGSKQRTGHGLYRLKGVLLKPHRLTYEAYIGPIPDGMRVLQSCYNPACVRPDHLFLSSRRRFKYERSDPVPRFWSKVDKSGECWVWTGGKDETGYGRFWTQAGRLTAAHRAAWELLVGPVPEGKEVHHTCGHRDCVHPDHLYLGT